MYEAIRAVSHRTRCIILILFIGGPIHQRWEVIVVDLVIFNLVFSLVIFPAFDFIAVGGAIVELIHSSVAVHLHIEIVDLRVAEEREDSFGNQV